MDFWYRLEDYRTAAPVDDWGMSLGQSTPRVRKRVFGVIRRTPKTVLLAETFGDLELWAKHSAERDWRSYWNAHRVVIDARRRFACPTLDEAKASFKARKERQIGIYRARIASIEAVLLLADRNQFGG